MYYRLLECNQLVICLLSHFIHIWYRGWPCSEHAHIIPIMTSCVHKMLKRTYGQTNMKRAITLAKINHPWNWYNIRMLRSWHAHIIPISWMVDFCESNSPFHVCLTIRPFPHLVYATSHFWCGNGRMVKQTWKGLQLSRKSTNREIGIICACSDHGQSRYQIWIDNYTPTRRVVGILEYPCPFVHP
jgi:hypothetical protein